MARRTKAFAIAVALVGLATEPLQAASSILTAHWPYQAHDVLSERSIAGYDVAGGIAYAWSGGSLRQLDIASGALVRDYGAMSDGYSDFFNSFVRIDATQGVVWLGFTVAGNTDDRIYEVDLGTGAWNHRATLPANHDLQVYGGAVYASALNSTTYTDPNGVYLLDTSGQNAHDLIAQVGGSAAGLDFDSEGNLYYAAYDGYGLPSELIRYSAAQVAGAVGAGHLDRLDAIKLSDTAMGAWDVAVGSDGSVYFNGNGIEFYVAKWDGTQGNGLNYEVVATGSGSSGNWHTYLQADRGSSALPLGESAEGDMALYQGDFNYSGLAEITLVPEPSSLALGFLGLCVLGFALARRKEFRR